MLGQGMLSRVACLEDVFVLKGLMETTRVSVYRSTALRDHEQSLKTPPREESQVAC